MAIGILGLQVFLAALAALAVPVEARSPQPSGELVPAFQRSCAAYGAEDTTDKIAGGIAGAIRLGAERSASESELERSDALLRAFDEKDDLESLRTAVSLLDELAKASPQDFEIAWRRARACQALGGTMEKEEDKLELFDRAIQSAKAAVKSKPAGVQGHYWLGTSFGSYGEAKGMFKALALIDDIRREMRTVIEIDPKYEDAGAYLVLGKIDFELPGWLGGDSKRAIEEYEKGLKLAPANALMKLYLSDSYLDAGRQDEAKKLLEELIALEPGEHATRDVRRARGDAQKSYAKHFVKQPRKRENY
jgi:tetratricopeptide (TPR) repeat protein